MSGKFITLEGPEGCGKSTQVALLSEQFETRGIRVKAMREPGGTTTGEAIRKILQHNAVDEPLTARAELLLFTASRAQLVEQEILPALNQGIWVLCDRFIDSTMAYQGFARGMDIETLDLINDFAIQLRKPDVTLLLDLDIELGFERLEKRYADRGESHDRFERETRDFHRRVRDGYHQLASREPGRFIFINADQTVQAVANDIWRAVEGALL